MITRRDIVVALGAGLLAPLTVFAQPAAEKVHRIGYLGPSEVAAPGFLNAFRESLRALGYVEGRNLVIEYRYTEGTGKGYATEAAELVASRVAVIAVSVSVPAKYASAATQTIPIVMLNSDTTRWKTGWLSASRVPAAT